MFTSVGEMLLGRVCIMGFMLEILSVGVLPIVRRLECPVLILDFCTDP